MKFFDACTICHRFLWKPTPICLDCLDNLKEPEILYRDVKGLPVFSLLHYVYPLEEIAKIWKTSQGENLCHSLALELALKFSSECLSPIVGVIPMPAKNKGDHDHAYLVAEVVSCYFKVPLASQFLDRTEQRSEQKTKTLYERNVPNVRLCADFSSWNETPGLGTWLLVDDVVTTGATLCNAWQILGKPRAVGLTLAATPRWSTQACLKEDFTLNPPRIRSR